MPARQGHQHLKLTHGCRGLRFVGGTDGKRAHDMIAEARWAGFTAFQPFKERRKFSGCACDGAAGEAGAAEQDDQRFRSAQRPVDDEVERQAALFVGDRIRQPGKHPGGAWRNR